jgi:hypothetical protein
MLLWCEVSFALTQQSAIDEHLSGRQLDQIEGIWRDSPNSVTGESKTYIIYKYGTSYNAIILYGTGTGTREWSVKKSSSGNYKGNCIIREYSKWDRKTIKSTHPGQSLTISQYSDDSFSWNCSYYIQGWSGSVTFNFSRLWPSSIISHNAKFEKKEEPKDKFIPSSGTAFFVTNKGHLVTNYHVVEGCKNKSKISFKDKEIKVKLLAKDKYLDLALLKADIKNKNFIKISNKAPKKLQRIIAAGYPLGKELSDDLKFTSGIVSSLKGLEDDSTRIQIDAALNPGNSGGPIVDEKNGELVAVAVSGLTKTQSINFGIKAGSVKNFLESNQITSLSQSNYSFGSVDLSDILENATVYTFCK